jgi:hypothetical protein
MNATQPENTQPQKLTLTARLVLAVGGALLLSGLVWHDITWESVHRFRNDLFGRPGGPMAFRFLLQPLMAFLAALHDGIQDARTGRTPFLWTVLLDRKECLGRLSEGLVSTARLLLIGIAMDAIYQFRVLGTLYPLEAIVTALVLGFAPYLLLRGPVTRIARRSTGGRSARTA